MAKNNNKTNIVWVPRVLVILFAGFLSLFALDVFSEGYGLGELVVAFFMHMVPVWVLLLALGVAWKKPVWGGVVYVGLGLVSIMAFNTYRHPLSLLLISGSPVVIGGLFVWVGNQKKIDRKS